MLKSSKNNVPDQCNIKGILPQDCLDCKSELKYFICSDSHCKPTRNKKFIFHDRKLLFRDKVNCPKGVFKLAFFGQLNAANHILSGKNIRTHGMYMYNYMNRSCYEYCEPVIGATGANGNVMTDLALQLKASLNKPVVVIAFGESGASVLDWQYGKTKDKLDQVLRSGSQLRGG